MREILLDERTGVKTIRDLHDALRDALSSGEEVVLDFSGMERMDLSVLQVLMAAQRAARRDKRVLKLKKVPPRVRAQLQIAGLAKGGGA